MKKKKRKELKQKREFLLQLIQTLSGFLIAIAAIITALHK